MNFTKFKEIANKFTQSKYFWPVFLIVIIVIYIYTEFNPLFTKIPSLSRYWSDDFERGFSSINYLLECFDIRHLRFYHWNQFGSAGSPNLADLGTYYFPNYILKLVSKFSNNFISYRISELYTLAYLVVAGLGFFLFVKTKIKTVWPAFFGALFFISSSYMVYVPWQNYIIGISLLPWIMITIEKYFSSKRFWWMMLAAFIAFQQFAILPQFFMYSMIFVFLYFISDAFNFKTIKSLLVFYLLTISYSAIAFLPLQELGESASRTKYFSYSYFNLSANSSTGIWQLALLKNNIDDPMYLYLGGVAISLIAIYFYTTKSRINWALLGTAVFLFLLTSSGTFSQSIMHLLPGLNSMRSQNRVNEIIIFILIMLLVKAIASYRFNFKRDLIILGAVAIFIILGYLLKSDFKPGNSDFLADSLFGLFIFSLALVARSRNIINDRFAMVIACILILLDLSRVVQKSRDASNVPFQLTPSGEIAHSEYFWGPNPIYATSNESRIPAENITVPGYNKFLINHNYAAGAFSSTGGDFSPAVLKRYDDYIKVAALVNSNLLSLANVNTPQGYLPRAFTQNCYRIETSDDSLLIKMEDTKFTGKDFIYLSEKPEIGDSNIDCQSSLIPIQSIQDKDKINFGTLKNDKPTILFISDNWYPGWNAYIDGKKKNIIRADYTFKAVAVPVGDHNVEFRYEPKSFKIGGLITWISVILSIIYALTVSLFTKRETIKIKNK